MIQECVNKDPHPTGANLARYLKCWRHFLWHPSNQQHLLHSSWGCLLQGTKAQPYPWRRQKIDRRESNPLLTCSWLRPQSREGLGEQIRASTSMVSPRAWTSDLSGEFCFNT